MEVCQNTHQRFPRTLLRRGSRLLLFVLAMVLLSASAASAYDLVAGGAHTCAIDDNGVTCWGWDGYGQVTVPAGLSNPTVLALGVNHTCAIDDNGVTCWGRDDYGQSMVPRDLVFDGPTPPVPVFPAGSAILFLIAIALVAGAVHRAGALRSI